MGYIIVYPSVLIKSVLLDKMKSPGQCKHLLMIQSQDEVHHWYAGFHCGKSTQLQYLIHTQLREQSFFTGSGGCLFVGRPDFLGWSKGGTSFFFSGPKGGPEFFEGQRGGGDQNFFSNFFWAPLAQFLLGYIIQIFFRPLAQSFSLPYFMPHKIGLVTISPSRWLDSDSGAKKEMYSYSW